MKSIVPFLWFDNQAEEAMKFYTSIFKNSKIVSVTRHPEGGPGFEGGVITGTFRINDQDFYVINGGPMFKFTEAISLFVNCENQDEVDYLWEKLSAGGQQQMCGWLKDKFGVSWQIIPTRLNELLTHKDPRKAQAAMKAMLKMKKIEVAKLEEAADTA